MKRPLPLLAAMVMLSAGCGGVDRAFRQEGGLRITGPSHGSTVTLPLSVRWADDDAGPARRYAVFVDRAPMPPGQDLDWLARDDDACRTSPGCPDEAWLNDHAVYTASGLEAAVRAVPSSVLGDRTRSDDGHRVVVVPLDREGRRTSEQVATRLFFVRSR